MIWSAPRAWCNRPSTAYALQPIAAPISACESPSYSATVVLLVHMAGSEPDAEVAATTRLPIADFGVLRIELVVHAGGGLLGLLAAIALSVFKPWGRTRFGV